MEQKYYSVERGQQILISLLKQHGIKKIIASPGTTNITFVGSAQNDSWFEVYSAADERSAAYIACGMAAESGEAVVLSCTGATASRNYVPGLTEAYYRKLPILAVTATQNENRIGHLIPQMMDRSTQMKDICVHSEHVAVPKDSNDEWDATIRLNRAVLALTHHGGGPVHINLATNYNPDFSVKELPVARCIHRYLPKDEWPEIPTGRVAIAVGSHIPWKDSLTRHIDRFCEVYGAVVLCEHGSNYTGLYRACSTLLNQQEHYRKPAYHSDLLIHIGEVTGYGNGGAGDTQQVWRVNEDGELRDLFGKLTNVFEMTEEEFFARYADMATSSVSRKSESDTWLKEFREENESLLALIPKLPFSNVWLAQQTAHRLPEDCVLHLGILNTMRTWALFEVPASVRGQGFTNTGGFGIDGCTSSMIGGALARPDRLHYLITGDLAFFYDLNALGNRHVGSNIRILLVNNGKGTEFRNYNHPAARFGESADLYMAAAGHYGNKSQDLIHHYAGDLGFEYLVANNKEEYLRYVDRFLDPSVHDRPMLFEVFTTSKDESDAIRIINNLKNDPKTLKQKVKDLIPEPVKVMINKIVK